jgi:importin-4
VLYSLFDVIADLMDSYIPKLMTVFAVTIHDPESLQVQVTTCQALGKIADFVEPNDTSAVSTFQDMIPYIVAVLQKCLSSGDDDGCSKIFEVFDELLVLVLTN